MAQLNGLTINGSVRLKLPVGNTTQRVGTVSGRYRYNNELSNQEFADGTGYQQIKIPDEYKFKRPDGSFSRGLAGKLFNGTWRTSIPGIQDGNIGGYDALPLTTVNQSTNVTTNIGQLPVSPYGVQIWPHIDWTLDMGDSYGGIWIGYFLPPTTGTYTFWTASDDGSGCWIGDLALGSPGNRTPSNATLNNNLGGGQGRTKRGASTTLTGGLWYPIRIVHEEGGGGDNMTFTWDGPGISENRNLLVYYRTRVGGNPGNNANFNVQVYGDF